MTDELASWDATATAAAIASGEVSITEVTDAAIGRIDKLNGELNAVITPLFDRARQRIADGACTGPFAGVPIVLKDYDGALGGEPYHCGMAALRDADHRAAVSDTNIARLEDAGFVVLGKTNTPELGLLPTTEPVAYGPSRNPWDTARSTGGSSGGSAAAVASRMVPIATAGDGGGSIRIPASECGLVGLKPSRGRVPVGPGRGEEWGGLVVRGVETRTVRDTAAALDLLGAPDHGAPYQATPWARSLVDSLTTPVPTLRIGTIIDPPLDGVSCQPGVATVVEGAAAVLTSLGHRVDDGWPRDMADPDLVTQFFPAFGSWAADAIEEKGRLIGRTLTADDVEPATWALYEMGKATSALDYLAAISWMHGYTRRVVSWWRPGPETDADGYDLLLTPTLPEIPPLLGEFAPEPDNPLAGSMRASALVPFMVPINVTGQPAISLPLGQVDGLPVGVQLVAAPGREDLLVQVAAQLEEAAPWIDRRPPVHA